MDFHRCWSDDRLPPPLTDGPDASEVLTQLIHVGTSAGEARAKAVIALNPVTYQMRSGQLATPDGFEQAYRRVVFNVAGVNGDDHTKNLAFLCDADGRWSLAPAFDVTYAHNPAGAWTAQHQMTVGARATGSASPTSDGWATCSADPAIAASSARSWRRSTDGPRSPPMPASTSCAPTPSGRHGPCLCCRRSRWSGDVGALIGWGPTDREMEEVR